MDAISEIIRDERQLEALRDLAAGRLTDDERRALEQRAQTDDALREAMAMCETKPDEFYEQLATDALAQMKKRTALPRRGRTASSYRRRMWVGGAAAIVAAVAASAVLVVRSNESARLPDYSARIIAAQEFRADTKDPNDVVSLTLDDTFVVVLRPAVRVEAPVDAWLFVDEDGALRPLDADLEHDVSGAIRAKAVVGSWGRPAELIIAVGPRDQPPSAQDVRSRPTKWRWMVRKLRVSTP